MNAFNTMNSMTKKILYLWEYPPGPLTGGSYSTGVAGYTYGNGTYTVSASSERNGAGTCSYAFDESLSTYWQWTKPASATTTVSGTSYTGEWVQLYLPVSIPIMAYEVGNTSTTNNMPLQWVLAGSTNGSTWYNLDDQTFSTVEWTSGYRRFFVSNNRNTNYNYFRFIYQNGNGTYPVLCELKFYAPR